MADDARDSEEAEVLDNWDDEEDDQNQASAASEPIQVVQKITNTTAIKNDTADSSDSDAESHEDSESQDEAGEGASEVLSTYRKLLSRRVDLVGDYAGNELFLIDGESMLLRCFSDETLDFDTGFQLLHAIYNVEQFLQQLAKRKCNFHVVFFSHNKKLCIPAFATSRNAVKFLLARAAAIRHLQSNLPAHSTIAVREFTSCTTLEFGEYLSTHSPYFVMAHDGATAASRKSKHLNESSISESMIERRVALRDMILYFVERGTNVALINGLEWRDTKVMAMVLESRHRSAGTPRDRGTTESANGIDTRDEQVSTDLENLREVMDQFTDREIVSLLAIAKLLRRQPENRYRVHARSFLVHQAVLMHLPLSMRRLASESTDFGEAASFLEELSTEAEAILCSSELRQLTHTFDLADLVDGRLFLQVSKSAPALTLEMEQSLDDLLKAVNMLIDTDLTRSEVTAAESSRNPANNKVNSHATVMSVMPFSNPVFDKHMASIRLEVDDNATGEQTASSHRIFREVTHWHNAKKPLIQRGPPTAQSEKQALREAKRNQMFMAEMQKYAASLTNAVGRSLEPESIIVGVTKPKLPQQTPSGRDTPPDSDSAESSSSNKNKGQPKKGGKKGQQNAGKQAMLNQIAAAKAKKDESVSDKIVGAWHVVCKGIEADSDPTARYRKAQSYLSSLPIASRNVLAAECQLYMLSCLVQYWVAICRRNGKLRHIEMTALIWDTCRSVVQSPGLTTEIVTCVEDVIKRLALPPVPPFPDSCPSRKLGFEFAKMRSTDDVSVGIDSNTFQLTYCGPYLERSFDSRPDHRVDFNPDGWQRRVLDGIDAEQSVFAVAPTSAGKTFISFYAMRKVLEADDDGVLVYVAPTKALVNQIAAEIQARYSKKFKYGGKSVWAIHTRDYRINNPTGCQVLVTVPHVLQIMLLAPTNANSWSSRVKRIIFDEVHSIGQAEDGVVWEQLLLLAPCPIVALSATVGNPSEFSEWLTNTQTAIGNELVTVQHPYRYSDLRKYYYVPPEEFAFQGLPSQSSFGTLGLDNTVGLNKIHPVAALVDRSRGIPEDLALEARDCLDLYNALLKNSTEEFTIAKELYPRTALPSEGLRKVDILHWERQLKDVLQQWIQDPASPFEAVLTTLEKDFLADKREAVQTTHPESAPLSKNAKVTADDLVSSTLPLLCRLHEQNALPAILFNYDRFQCEKITRAIVEQLAEAEESQIKSGEKWDKKLEKWEEWKKVQEKLASAKGAKASKKKIGSKGDDADDEKTSKLDQQRDAGAADASAWESFNPEDPIDGFHFADHNRVLPSEMEVYVRQLRWRDVPQWLIDGLKRGVGVHHAGMNRKYRQVCEILFRKGFLRVVVATGTLALGINMPCKSVVFSGDSVFLTALNYRQCAGRAGRRGFDLLGNVVFQGISRQKVCRLISSRLPDLNGHFPITTTLVLRLFTLLHESKNSKYAASAINALLSQPRLYMGGPSFKDQTMHHLRFSIEYLRRQHLLAASGAPLNFAGLVSHLYFTENSSFAFHALLKEGYFHQLCSDVNESEKSTLETMMLVMAHLFGRRYCRQSDEEYREKVVKPSSSIVFLPPMPVDASRILREHNRQTLDVYRTYVETFVDQHITTEDRTLPLTGMEIGTTSDADAPVEIGVRRLPSTKTRSSFVALSGLGDDFESISELCQTTREGVFLEEAVIPHVGVHPDETGQPLNAWLLDFYKHGDVHTIERANGIRRSEIWFMLNDFSLVLATLIASLMGFMKLKEGTDMDMLDIMGNLDAHEEAEDEAESAMASSDAGKSMADYVMSVSERPKGVTQSKAKKADSWEDIADEEDAITRREDRKAGLAAEVEAMDEAYGVQKTDEGLKVVLKAFTKLQAEFNTKFKAMWA